MTAGGTRIDLGTAPPPPPLVPLAADAPPTAPPPVYWSPCSSSHDLSPADAPIYVDDAAVSLVRLGPNGAL